MARVAVLGAGAWGTALASVLSARLEVALWARDRAQAQAIAASRRNERNSSSVRRLRALIRAEPPAVPGIAAWRGI